MVDFSTVTRLRGLALPAVKGPGGYFESKSPLDVAWGDLLFALFVPRASRPMRRNFGSVLREQLFEPNIEQEHSIIDYVIREAARENCPHITIREVLVFKAPQQPNSVQVRVWFALKTDTADVQNREVVVSKIHLSTSLV